MSERVKIWTLVCLIPKFMVIVSILNLYVLTFLLNCQDSWLYWYKLTSAYMTKGNVIERARVSPTLAMIRTRDLNDVRVPDLSTLSLLPSEVCPIFALFMVKQMGEKLTCLQATFDLVTWETRNSFFGILSKEILGRFSVVLFGSCDLPGPIAVSRKRKDSNLSSLKPFYKVSSVC